MLDADSICQPCVALTLTLEVGHWVRHWAARLHALMLARTWLLLDNVFLPDAPGFTGSRLHCAVHLRGLCGTARSAARPSADACDPTKFTANPLDCHTKRRLRFREHCQGSEYIPILQRCRNAPIVSSIVIPTTHRVTADGCPVQRLATLSKRKESQLRTPSLLQSVKLANLIQTPSHLLDKIGKQLRLLFLILSPRRTVWCRTLLRSTIFQNYGEAKGLQN